MKSAHKKFCCNRLSEKKVIVKISCHTLGSFRYRLGLRVKGVPVVSVNNIMFFSDKTNSAKNQGFLAKKVSEKSLEEFFDK